MTKIRKAVIPAAGSAEFMGKDLLALEPSDRASLGLFLAFQYPKEIAGVTLRSFLFAAYKAQSAVRESLPKEMKEKITDILEQLDLHDKKNHLA
jgi:Fe-S cluster assembly ATPase SufC